MLLSSHNDIAYDTPYFKATVQAACRQLILASMCIKCVPRTLHTRVPVHSMLTICQILLQSPLPLQILRT